MIWKTKKDKVEYEEPETFPNKSTTQVPYTLVISKTQETVVTHVSRKEHGNSFRSLEQGATEPSDLLIY